MYCLWDAINHVQSLLIDRNSQPKTYWINSSANAIITDIIESKNFKIDNKQDKISALCQGQCIEANIEEFFTYENLHSSDDTLWNLLFLTGYLTLSPSSNTDAKDGHEWGRASFLLPNKEITTIFKAMAEGWFRKKMRDLDRSELFEAFWQGDAPAFENKLSEILLQSISYYDSQAEFCHGFVAGLFTGSGYRLESNREYGNGRPDLVIVDERHRRAAIIEVKFTKDPKLFPRLASDCLSQINAQSYQEPFVNVMNSQIVLWGLAFCQKRCLAKCLKEAELSHTPGALSQ